MLKAKCAKPHCKCNVRITKTIHIRDVTVIPRVLDLLFSSYKFSYHGSYCRYIDIFSLMFVAELPVTFKKKLADATVQEQDAVRLEVELSKPSTEVKWMKNGVVLQPGGNLEIHVDGAKQTLVLKSVTYSDRGHYSCETLDDKTQAKLTVESMCPLICLSCVHTL